MKTRGFQFFKEISCSKKKYFIQYRITYTKTFKSIIFKLDEFLYRTVFEYYRESEYNHES